MKRIYKPKQQATSKTSQTRQTKKHEKQTLPIPSHDEIVQNYEEDEGIYAQLREEEKFRSYHIAKLLSTPGYEHLTAEAAADRVDQMLRLCCIICDIVKRDASIKQQTLALSEEEPTESKPKSADFSGNQQKSNLNQPGSKHQDDGKDN